MREIKYRGKRVDTGEWVYGDLLTEQNKVSKNTAIVFYDGYMIPKSKPVYKETVGQYTGLNDNKGKQIYEGDILRGRKYCLTVVFYKGMFSGKQHGVSYSEPLISWELDFFEVIGNIHSNPELLEVQNAE